MKTVGILGGGQLGAMLAERLRARYARVRVFDPDSRSPGIARCADDATVAPWNDDAALERFARGCDVLTCEFESVPAAAAEVAARHAPLAPDARVLAIAQHRVREKEFLRKAGFPHARFAAIDRAEELLGAAEALGYPLVVETASGGYDRKGQRTVTTPDDLAGFARSARRAGFGDVGFVLEERVDLAVEISCIVARSALGDEVVFPVVENLHRDHALDFSVVPARVPPAIADAAQRIAIAAARALGVVGLLAVEFFVARMAPRGERGETIDGAHLLVNEIAPRPHNSGHVTHIACSMDYFDALARVLLGVPLEQPRLVRAGAFCIGNLFGEHWRDGAPPPALAGARRGASLCELVLYGKDEARPRRKMGHFSVHAATAEAALATARSLRHFDPTR
jgi:5-(carboxyamino)imidazole ribonucleotide synthase